MRKAGNVHAGISEQNINTECVRSVFIQEFIGLVVPLNSELGDGHVIVIVIIDCCFRVHVASFCFLLYWG